MFSLTSSSFFACGVLSHYPKMRPPSSSEEISSDDEKLDDEESSLDSSAPRCFFFFLSFRFLQSQDLEQYPPLSDGFFCSTPSEASLSINDSISSSRSLLSPFRGIFPPEGADCAVFWDCSRSSFALVSSSIRRFTSLLRTCTSLLMDSNSDVLDVSVSNWSRIGASIWSMVASISLLRFWSNPIQRFAASNSPNLARSIVNRGSSLGLHLCVLVASTLRVAWLAVSPFGGVSPFPSSCLDVVSWFSPRLDDLFPLTFGRDAFRCVPAWAVAVFPRIMGVILFTSPTSTVADGEVGATCSFPLERDRAVSPPPVDDFLDFFFPFIFSRCWNNFLLKITLTTFRRLESSLNANLRKIAQRENICLLTVLGRETNMWSNAVRQGVNTRRTSL